MKKLLFILLVSVFSVETYSQVAVFDQYNFEEGGYCLMGITGTETWEIGYFSYY